MSSDQKMYINLAKAAMNALDRGSLGQAMEILQLMTKIPEEPKTTHKAPELPQDQRSTKDTWVSPKGPCLHIQGVTCPNCVNSPYRPIVTY